MKPTTRARRATAVPGSTPMNPTTRARRAAAVPGSVR
jgi:hypothetical protein